MAHLLVGSLRKMAHLLVAHLLVGSLRKVAHLLVAHLLVTLLSRYSRRLVISQEFCWLMFGCAALPLTV